MKLFRIIFIVLIVYLTFLIFLFVKDKFTINSQQYVYIELPGRIHLPGNHVDYSFIFNQNGDTNKLQQHKIDNQQLESIKIDLRLRNTHRITLDFLLFLFNRVDLILFILVFYILMNSTSNFSKTNIPNVIFRLMQSISVLIFICFIAKILLSYIIGNILFSIDLKSDNHTAVVFPRIIVNWMYLFTSLILFLFGYRLKKYITPVSARL